MFARKSKADNLVTTQVSSGSTATCTRDVLLKNVESKSTKTDVSGDYDLVEEEKQTPKYSDSREPRLTSVAFEMMKRQMFRKKEYPTFLSGSTNAVALSSGAASLKVSWDPSSLASFVDFALLFSQYRVRKVTLKVWFPNQSVTTLAAPGPTAILIGADPGMAITGAATSTNVSDLSRREYWNAINTNKSCADFTTTAREVPLALDPAGFLDVTSSWTGQTVVFAQADASSSAPAFVYQVIYDVLFRNRY